jgi:L-iditol 2-dehydrogenase
MFRIPEGAPALASALVEPLACALKGVDDAFVAAGDRVLILGSGPLGVMLALLSVRSGARVALLGRGEARLKAVRDQGLEALDYGTSIYPEAKVKELLGGRPDKVIEAVGDPQAWSLGLDAVAAGGLVLFFGGCAAGTQVALDTGRIHYEEISIRGSFHHSPGHVREALDLLAADGGGFSFLVSGEASLDEIPEVFQRLDRREIPFKLALRP